MGPAEFQLAVSRQMMQRPLISLALHLLSTSAQSPISCELIRRAYLSWGLCDKWQPKAGLLVSITQSLISALMYTICYLGIFDCSIDQR